MLFDWLRFKFLGERLHIEVQILRSYDLSSFNIRVEQLVHSSLKQTTCLVESNDKFIKSGRKRKRSTSDKEFADETSDEETELPDSKVKTEIELQRSEISKCPGVLKRRRLVNFDYVATEVKTEAIKVSVLVENENTDSFEDNKVKLEPQLEANESLIDEKSLLDSDVVSAIEEPLIDSSNYEYKLGKYSQLVSPSGILLSPRHLYDPYLHAANEKHIILFDSAKGMHVFDSVDLSAIDCDNNNDGRGKESKRMKKVDARFACLSPLALAVAAFNPGRPRSCLLYSCAITSFVRRVFGCLKRR